MLDSEVDGASGGDGGAGDMPIKGMFKSLQSAPMAPGLHVNKNKKKERKKEVRGYFRRCSYKDMVMEIRAFTRCTKLYIQVDSLHKKS